MWELLVSLIQTGDLETLKIIIEGNPDLLMGHDPSSGFTALQLACRHNKVDIVKFFITQEAVDVNQVSNTAEKMTALHVVIEKGFYPLIPLLLKHRANVNIPDSKGSTPIDAAVKKKYPKQTVFSLLQYSGFIECSVQEQDRLIFLKLATTLMYESQRYEWNASPCRELRRYMSYLFRDFPGIVKQKIKVKNTEGKYTTKTIEKQVNISTATATREQLSQFLATQEQQDHTYFSSYISEDSDSDLELKEDKNELKDEKKYLGKAKAHLFNARLSDAKIKAESKRKNSERFKFFQLQERQKIEREQKNLQEIKEDLAKLNKAIKDGKVRELIKSGEIKTQFVVAQYRGINYFTDKWNQNSRRAHREFKERRHPQYCEAILRTSSVDFYRNFRQFSNQGVEFKKELHGNARKLKAHLVDILHNDKPFYIKKDKEYIYDTQGHADQDEYSKGVLEHLTKMEQRRSADPVWKAALPNNNNYKFSTSAIPYHALRYAYCLKDYYTDSLLYPNIRKNGRAERPYVGKVYISLHPIEDYMGRGAPLHLATENKEGNSQLDSQIATERETSFLSFLPEERVFDQHIAKFPSFNKAHRPSIHLKKYGLDPGMFFLFKNAFARYAPHTDERIYIERLLAEWLCAFHEVRLLDRVVREARSKNQVVVYRDNLGGFSLDPTPVVPPSSDKAGWKAINSVRSQRGELAEFLHTLHPGKQEFTAQELEVIHKNPTTPEKYKKVINRLLASTPRKKLADPLKNHRDAYSTPKKRVSDDDDFGIGNLSLSTNSWLPSDYREVNVPDDHNCLFWSAALSRLLPVLDNKDLFNEVYSQLFGDADRWIQLESKTEQKDAEAKLIDINTPDTREGVRHMLLTYDCQQHTPLLFEGELLETLVCDVFRNRVVDHMDQWDEETRLSIQTESDWQTYSNKMRQRTTWGDEPEIKAMSQMFHINIQLQGITYHQEYPFPEAKQTLYLRHVEEDPDPDAPVRQGNHYHFGLHQDYYYRHIENVSPKKALIFPDEDSEESEEEGDEPSTISMDRKKKTPTTPPPSGFILKSSVVPGASPKPLSGSPNIVKYSTVFAASAHQLHLKRLSHQLYQHIKTKNLQELGTFFAEIKNPAMKKELLNTIGPEEKELPVVLAGRLAATSEGIEKKPALSMVKFLIVQGAEPITQLKTYLEQIKKVQPELIDSTLESMINVKTSEASC